MNICWEGLAKFAPSLFGKTCKTLANNTPEAQWQHYVGLCGNWRGKWHRYSLDPTDGKPVLGKTFQAYCNPTLDCDGQCVRHINRYEPGSEPPGKEGKIVDGFIELEMGSFTRSNYLAPFGPHSLALYLTDAAVVVSASLPSSSSMVAMEMVLATSGQPRQRRRMVAVWKVVEAADRADLASITLIEETEERKKEETEEEGIGREKSWKAVKVSKVMRKTRSDTDIISRTSWHSACRTVTNVNGSATSESCPLSLGAVEFALAGGTYAWMPRKLPLQSSGQLEVAMGWSQEGGRFVRLAATYSDGEFASVVKDEYES